MRIERLNLMNYRNYEHSNLLLHPGLNIVIGQNAQGKTNLLESVHFLSTGRSHRTNNQLDLIRWQAPGFFLLAELSKSNVSIKLEFGLEKDRKRQLKINGIPEKRLSTLLGNLNSVLFAPEDLQLLKGPPALRRRFLDIELAQVSPIYLHSLQQYNRVLLQKNNLLRAVYNRTASAASLDAWNEQLVTFGSRVILNRMRAIQSLQRYASSHLLSISRSKEQLVLTYKPFGRPPDVMPVSQEAISNLFWDMLQQERKNELSRRQSLVGPHRDDFASLINGIDVRDFGSQGQQRSTVLALKLAELELMHEMTGQYPVLLLDDVLSELDESRREALLSQVDRGVQTLLTGTEASLFAGLKDKSALVAEIENGRISIVR